MYEMNLDKVKKTFQVKVKGFIKEDEAARYMKDYQDHVSKIRPAEYTLIVDGTEQAAVPQALIEDLKGALQFYASGGFKRVAIIEPRSAISRIQVKKCADSIGFKHGIYKTIEDALHM